MNVAVSMQGYGCRCVACKERGGTQLERLVHLQKDLEYGRMRKWNNRVKKWLLPETKALAGRIAEELTKKGINVGNVANETLEYYVKDLLPSCLIRWEGMEIVRLLKSGNSAFASLFFYEMLSEMLGGLSFKVQKIFHVEYDANSLATMAYEFLWDEGRWSPFDSFKYESSIFTWLATVLTNKIFEEMEALGYSRPHEVSVNNVRLKLLSQPEILRQAVVDLVEVDQFHRLLELYYVEKKSDEVIMEVMKLDEKLYQSMKKNSERMLKVVLLTTEEGHEYAPLVLRSKYTEKQKDNTPDLLFNLSDLIGEGSESSMLEDVLGTAEEMRNSVNLLEDFLIGFSEKMGWKPKDRYVWQQRFIYNVSPAELAQELGVARHWIDLHYSRMNKVIREAFVSWWKKYAA